MKTFRSILGPLVLSFASVGMLSGCTRPGGSSDTGCWDTEYEAQPVLGAESGYVESVAFSPDGTILASGDTNGTVILWDLAGRKELKRLRAHTEFARSIAFSPDGKILATSGSSNRKIRLWEVGEGTELKTLEGHSEGVKSVAFHPNGASLASGSADETVRTWKIPEGALLKTIEGHEGTVTSVAFDPDGRLLASGSNDKTARLWDAVSGKEHLVLVSRPHGVTAIAFSADGKRLAVSTGERITIWDHAEGGEFRWLEGKSPDTRFASGPVMSIAYRPGGKVLASGSKDKTVRLWKVVGDPQSKILGEDSKYISSVAFSRDGKNLAAGGRDGIRLWVLSHVGE